MVIVSLLEEKLDTLIVVVSYCKLVMIENEDNVSILFEQLINL